jgi:hypothetical protein
MQRLTAIFGALMLVLFVWTGSAAAHSTQRFDCIPISSEGPGHFEGDRDEAPANGEKGIAHHHSGCNGHQYATPSGFWLPPAPHQPATTSVGWNERRATSREPDRQLRPPIA